MNNLKERIEILEMKISYQERFITELSDVITQQQNSIDKLSLNVQYMKQHIKPKDDILAVDEEVPPPHY